MLNVKFGGFVPLPPPPDCCQVCAARHRPDEPHDASSLFYQTAFALRNEGRAPTWEDGMRHCAEGVRELWRAELRRLGVDPAAPARLHFRDTRGG